MDTNGEQKEWVEHRLCDMAFNIVRREPEVLHVLVFV